MGNHVVDWLNLAAGLVLAMVAVLWVANELHGSLDRVREYLRNRGRFKG